MELPEKAVLLRVYLSEGDKADGRPLYQELVRHARDLGLAGATVLRGILGYGAGSHMHSAKLLDLSTDLPLVVEIVDTEENVEKLMPFIQAHAGHGLVTREAVGILKYGHRA